MDNLVENNAPSLPVEPTRTGLSDLFKDAEDLLNKERKAIDEWAECCKVARSVLKKEKTPQHELASLLATMRTLWQKHPLPKMETLGLAVAEYEKRLRVRFELDFVRDLGQACTGQGVDMKAINDDSISVGPLVLHVNYGKGSGKLVWATTTIEKDVPLDPMSIAKRAAAFSEELLAPVADVNQLRDDFREAIQVSLLREGKLNSRGDVHEASLPAVHEEMGLIRQRRQNKSKKKSLIDYPVWRFVADLEVLLKSETRDSERRKFSIQQAVLENTGISSRSICMPRDLRHGSSEPTYFQTIIWHAAESQSRKGVLTNVTSH